MLGTWCKDNGNIKLISPQSCQAAVVKGAALRGLLGQGSDSTQCRRYYGFSAAHVFESGDDESSSFVCQFTKRKFCSGKMDWMVHKVRSHCSIDSGLGWRLTQGKGRDYNLSSNKVSEVAFQHSESADSRLQSQSLYV